MAIIETEGLVLKTYSLAEADKIGLILTPEYGLVRGVAKGAKRLKSRFGGGLEPFSIIHLSYFQKEERELVSIKSIDLKESFFDKAADPLFLQKFGYLAELLVEFAPPGQANERLYRMACVSLEAADETNLDSIALYFEIWLLKLLGFLPGWEKCENCGNVIPEHETASLQVNFQLRCAVCQKTKSGFKVSPPERWIFNFAQGTSPLKFSEAVRGETAALKEVSGILKRLIGQIIGKDVTQERIFAAKAKSQK